jgi:hypothetical protein
VLTELSRLAFDLDDIEFDDDGLFLRPGLPRDILRKLRRTHWVIQDHLDLHGMTGDEAVEATAQFLAECKRRGLRCVRIIHGKGLRSHGREPGAQAARAPQPHAPRRGPRVRRAAAGARRERRGGRAALA